MNKRRFFTFILMGFLFLSACGSLAPTPDMSATGTSMANDFYGTQTSIALPTVMAQTAVAAATNLAHDFYAAQTLAAFQATDTPFPTQDYSTLTVNLASNVRSGPSSDYPINFTVQPGDVLTIVGQTSYCGWFSVLTYDGRSGWVWGQNVTFNGVCSRLPVADVPALPGGSGGGSGGGSSSGGGTVANTPVPGCDASSGIDITNSTGGSITIQLDGPASYNFNLGTGDTTLSVCEGSYSYTAWGCGGASTSGTINTGEAHEFYCS